MHGNLTAESLVEGWESLFAVLACGLLAVALCGLFAYALLLWHECISWPHPTVRADPSTAV